MFGNRFYDEPPVPPKPNEYHIGAKIQRFYDILSKAEDDVKQYGIKKDLDDEDKAFNRGQERLLEDLTASFANIFDDLIEYRS